MKNIFKLITFGLLLSAFPQNTTAYWENQDLLIAETEQTTLELEGDTLTTERILTINPTEENSWQGFFVFPQGTKNIKLYWDLNNLPFETLTGREKLETLFDEAQKNEDSNFLKMGTPLFPILIKTESRDLSELSTLKITYETELLKNENWKIFAMPTNIGTSAKKQEIFIRYPKELFFLNNLEDPIKYQFNTTVDQKNIQVEYINQTHKTPTVFAWNEQQEALSQFYKGFNYQAIPQEPQNIDSQNITILIDKSGSIDEGKWQKTIDVIRYLLNDLWSDKNIRLGLFDDTLSWKTTNDEQEPIFQENTFEWRQEIVNSLPTLRPLGKTDLEEVLNTAQENVPANHTWILITDEEKPGNIDTPYPLGVLGFKDSEEKLDSWEDGKTWTQSLFATQAAFLEQTEIQENINHWYQTNVSIPQNISSQIEETQILNPNPKLKNPFIIGRKNETSSTDPLLSFLPQAWAQEKNKALALEDTQVARDAINSIRVVFGLNEQDAPDSELIDGVPTYNGTAYDFGERNNTNTTLQIAPFSEAQKELFLQYPEQVAEGFGIGSFVEFCTDIRCLQVTEEGKTESDPFLKAYWNEKDPNHWAREFAEPMVKQGIYPIAENGNLELDSAIKRGDFAQMLYEQIPAQRWRKGNALTFIDLPEEHPAHEAISFFSEHKIIQGYGDETVKPEANISRAEAVKILLAADLYKPSEETEESYFKDTKDWVIPWTNEAQRRNIIQGYDNLQFKPHEFLSKGQAAKLVTKFAE